MEQVVVGGVVVVVVEVWCFFLSLANSVSIFVLFEPSSGRDVAIFL